MLTCRDWNSKKFPPDDWFVPCSTVSALSNMKKHKNLVFPHFKNSSDINHGIFSRPWFNFSYSIQSVLTDAFAPLFTEAGIKIAINVLDFMLRLFIRCAYDPSTGRKIFLFRKSVRHHVMNETRDFSTTSEQTSGEFPTFFIETILKCTFSLKAIAFEIPAATCCWGRALWRQKIATKN